MFTSTVTSKGQVTIPHELRELLNLHAGDKVEFVKEGDHIAIFPKLDDMEAAFGLCRVKKKVSLADMDEAIRRKIKREQKRVDDEY